MKRVVSCALLLVLIMCVLPVTAFANGPAPMRCYEFSLSGLPEGTMYVDLLIPLTTDEPEYTQLEVRNLVGEITAQSQIVAYCEDGFRSYTFHYKNALSVITLQENTASFFATWETVYDEEFGEWYTQETGYRYGHREDIENRREIRLAMLDKKGNILQVSSTCLLSPEEPLAYLLGGFHYDAATDTWEAEEAASGIGRFLYMILSIAGIIITCLLERLVAWPFKLGAAYGRMILLVNLVSQIVMRILTLALYGPVFRHYGAAVLILELLVYTGEFFFYRWKMPGVSFRKCLAYTVTANTVSLLVGLYLNYALLF